MIFLNKITLRHDGMKLYPWRIYIPTEPNSMVFYANGEDALRAVQNLVSILHSRGVSWRLK